MAKKKTVSKKAVKKYSKSYYSKKPLWQWVLIYIVIGGIAYAAIYFLVMAKNNSMYTVPTSTAPAYNLPGY